MSLDFRSSEARATGSLSFDCELQVELRSLTTDGGNAKGVVINHSERYFEIRTRVPFREGAAIQMKWGCHLALGEIVRVSAEHDYFFCIVELQHLLGDGVLGRFLEPRK